MHLLSISIIIVVTWRYNKGEISEKCTKLLVCTSDFCPNQRSHGMVTRKGGHRML